LILKEEGRDIKLTGLRTFATAVELGSLAAAALQGFVAIRVGDAGRRNEPGVRAILDYLVGSL